MTVARRLILWIVCFSVIITLASTVIQLYIDYRSELGVIDERLNEIEENQLNNLTYNIWVLDDEQIQVFLTGLVNSPYIEYVSITEDNDVRWVQGAIKSERTVEREVNLTLTNDGQSFNLGSIRIVAGLNPVFANIKSRAFIILASNAVVISLIAGFFLFVFQYQISRHLLTLSNFARNVKLESQQPSLSLSRTRNPDRPDELDDVVSALNLMRQNIETSYLALRESEQYNRMLFDQSPIGLALTKQDGTFVDANPAFRKIVGYEGQELTGLSIWNITPESEIEAERERFNAATSGATTSLIEREVVSQSGKKVPVQFAYHSLERAGQIFTGISMQDISDRKASEIALAKSEEQLRQSEKMRAVGELTGGVAHDFNNLLAIVLGNAELLEEKLKPEGEEMSHLKVLISAALRGAELTQQLLAFSRKQMLTPKTTNLTELVDKMAGMLARVLGESIKVNTRFQSEIWPCNVDQGQLENAIINLAINARDAINSANVPEGVLTIEIANTTVDEEAARHNEDVIAGDYVMLSISDNGSGIPEEILDRIFEPFFTTKQVGEGTGLGLSMIYGFVKQSGGHVLVYSEVNVGTTVKLFLPKALEESAGVDEDMTQQQFKTGSETILVLEDDPDVRELTVLQLKSLGYNVLQAHDGASALDVLDKNDDIDLLLSDVVLPGGLRGPEVAIKARESKPELNVLFMSGYTQNALEAHTELGDSALLINKPFRKKDLADKIREAIEK
ncbi:PAS domain S-box protein [Sneathiella limimaris]|uniref:PAS domain S-box protein n=1 Tax=Sneathiella limimaris TaxID=1964213 RepID=UPI001469C22B|nr:PAS domain S-box protein [Sneathiella limimaris]